MMTTNMYTRNVYTCYTLACWGLYTTSAPCTRPCSQCSVVRATLNRTGATESVLYTTTVSEAQHTKYRKSTTPQCIAGLQPQLCHRVCISGFDISGREVANGDLQINLVIGDLNCLLGARFGDLNYNVFLNTLCKCNQSLTLGQYSTASTRLIA